MAKEKRKTSATKKTKKKHVNKKHKDSLFSLLFAKPHELLALYNAITNTNYDARTQIVINTLTNAIYMNRINDISFTIGEDLVILIEQQATINDNMPLRLLLYIARVYEKILEGIDKSLFKGALIKLPRPRFIVLYNGAAEYPDKKIVHLSDAFFKVTGFIDINLELEVEVYNINYGHNPEILAKYKTLNEYSAFVDRVRTYNKIMDEKSAMDKAVKDCIEENILKDFLKSISSEVFNMLFKEWNQVTALEVRYEEGFEKGIEKGIGKGIEKGIEKVAMRMKGRGVPIEQIAEDTGLSPHEIVRL
ncbi:RpnC/YadD family protein [Breznakiellaceae bacterium SP9]